ncbi:MAG: OmpA family protein [candidate division WOR-3 bacterium]
MKKIFALTLVALMFSLLFIGCPKKAVKEEVVPPPEEEEEVETPPPPPEKPTLTLETIHFDFDKYDIRPGDAEILKRNAEILKQYPDVKIIIEGHCCPIGTNEYNLGLGQRRANAAKEYLVKLGISPDRIETISYGEERLITTDPKEYWKNRRCEFKVKE